MSAESKSQGKTTKGKNLTPRQKKFFALWPRVASAELTLEAALKMAGYSETSAKQQSVILASLRKTSEMQNALRKAGFDQDFIAKTLVGDLKKLRPGQARRQYLELGAKLADAFPVAKQINADVGVEDLLDEADNGTDYSGWSNDKK